ncbi:hypothetical protein GQ55_9G575600 [Panicum hallii var. hallii]|uniref:Uncharacterized protein n=1 Tax=Panicum hallii var. hallii TaxID=1504633 RepID=A0A2T7CG65_9POAL|nr:hypothetical protein GQ55_9G575600 [Panicum hallii var. hallii]
MALHSNPFLNDCHLNLSRSSTACTLHLSSSDTTSKISRRERDKNQCPVTDSSSPFPVLNSKYSSSQRNHGRLLYFGGQVQTRPAATNPTPAI